MRNGSTLMLGFLVFGLGVLGGGQIWAMTGSIPLGAMGGGMVVLMLGGIFRKLRKRRKIFGLFGEVHGVIEEEFTDLIEDEVRAKTRVEEKVQQRPERAAGSVRSMLEKGQGRRGGKTGRS